jgi:hypothetical protein
VARHQGHSHLHSAQVRGHGGEVGDRLERVVIQEDQVTSVAGGNRALAIGAPGQGSGLVRERAGIQGSRSAAERCTAAAMAKPHAGLDHRSKWEAAVRPVMRSDTPMAPLDRWLASTAGDVPVACQGRSQTPQFSPV